MIIGIDVSKDKLDVAFGDQHKVIANTQASIEKLFKQTLKVEKIQLVVFEATGGYEKRLLVSLLGLKIPFHRANGFHVRRFSESKRYHAKTDKLDAQILVKYGEQEEVEADELTEQMLRQREWASRQNQLKQEIQVEQCRQKGMYIDQGLKKSSQRLIKQLKKELEKVTGVLDRLLGEDEEQKARIEVAMSMPGIGKETATALVVWLGELGSRSREEIASIAGLAPRTRESGKSKGYASIGGGRSQVRKVLYMAALVAVRHNKRMKGIYEGMVARGKRKKVALVAVMRKMLVVLNTMMKTGEMWEDRV